MQQTLRGVTVLVMLLFLVYKPTKSAPQQAFIPKGLQGSWVVPLPENYTLDGCPTPDAEHKEESNPWKSKRCSGSGKNNSGSGQGHITTEFTWAEFMQEYQDKENQGPELDLLRRLFPLPDTLLARRLYYLLLRVASDGTLIDLVNRHNAKQESPASADTNTEQSEEGETMKTEALELRMEVYARQYLTKVKDKPYFTLFDYFEDVYKHQFHEWTWTHERRRVKRQRREKRRLRRRERDRREKSRDRREQEEENERESRDGAKNTGGGRNKVLQEVVWVEGDEADLLAQELGKVFVTTGPEDEDEAYLLEVRFKDQA